MYIIHNYYEKHVHTCNDFLFSFPSWTIPKHVVHLINANIPQHNEYGCLQGILEVMMYPDLVVTTIGDTCLGSLTFMYENPLPHGKVHMCF